MRCVVCGRVVKWDAYKERWVDKYGVEHPHVEDDPN